MDEAEGMRCAVEAAIQEALRSRAPMPVRVAGAVMAVAEHLQSAGLHIVTGEFAEAAVARVRGAEMVCDHYKDMYVSAVGELRRLAGEGVDVDWTRVSVCAGRIQ